MNPVTLQPVTTLWMAQNDTLSTLEMFRATHIRANFKGELG